MKESTRAVINEMIELKQWTKDNGPIDFKLDNYFKYSGEVEKNFLTEAVETKQLTKYEIYKLFNRNTTKRGRAIYCHIVNPQMSITHMSKRLKIAKETIKNALSEYYTHMRINK